MKNSPKMAVVEIRKPTPKEKKKMQLARKLSLKYEKKLKEIMSDEES